MKSLTQIIETLKPGEVRLIRNYYKIQQHSEIQKRADLFDLIKSGKVDSDQKACRMLYNRPPHSAYSHLKARLQRDILNLLLLQDGSKRYDTPFARASFDCRRMLIEGRLLIERGADKAGRDLLEKVRTLANQYDLFFEAVMANEVLRSNAGIREGIAKYEEYDEDIRVNLDYLKKYLKSRDYYHRILVPNVFNKNQGQHYLEYSEEALNQLDRYYKETGKSTIGFLYYYVGIFFYSLNKDYGKALDSAFELLKLVEAEPAVMSKTYIATANMQIAGLQVHMGDYHQAMEYAELASNQFRKGLINELTALEILYIACFRSGNLEKGLEIYERAREHPRLKSSKMLTAKWDYFRANLLFRMGKTDDAYDLLMQHSELAKDKAGWLLGMRILEIMCLMENDEVDIIDYRIQSFKKLLQRQKKENVARVKAIVKVADVFVKTGGSFKRTSVKEAATLQLLSHGDDPYQWESGGFEQNRFDEWFVQKLKGDEY